MGTKEAVEKRLADIRAATEAGPGRGAFQFERAIPLLKALLEGLPAPALPAALPAGERDALEDFRANWQHQVWHHLTELVRVCEGRKDRAKAQGGDGWTNVLKPAPERELLNHLRELAKLRALLEKPPRLSPVRVKRVFFEDAALSAAGEWEHPAALAVDRDAEKGVCWQGQNPGGDWFWLRRGLPEGPVQIEFDVHPVSTIKGGLISAFCLKALRPDTPLSVASSPSMADYFKNFDAYHFSVHRGSSGYCNLRRTGVGLVMLASFPDPCPQALRWYRVAIVKQGPTVQLSVDGRLAVSYLDLGHIAPALDGGHFGLRHFQGFKGWHRNVRVSLVAFPGIAETQGASE